MEPLSSSLLSYFWPHARFGLILSVASEYTVASLPSTHHRLSCAALVTARFAHFMHLPSIACSATGHRFGRITTPASNGNTSTRRVAPSSDLL